jgi:hypothetical protein
VCHDCHSACRPVRHDAHHPIGTGIQPLPERCIPTTLPEAGAQGQPSTVPNYSEKYLGSRRQQLLGVNCFGVPIRSTTLQHSTAIHHFCGRSPDVGKGARHYSTIAQLCIPLLPLSLMTTKGGGGANFRQTSYACNT